MTLRRSAFRLLALCALTGLATGTSALALDAPAAPPPPPKVGEPAPAFDLPTADGKRVSLESLRGKTVVLNAWATWCPPCRLETPDLVTAYKNLGGSDVVFIGIDSTEAAPLVRAFAAAKNIAWTQAIDEHQTFSKRYDVRYFPTTWVIDPAGVLRAMYVDVMTPKLLASFVADAKAGHNGRFVSALQTKVDALLAPEQYPLTGDEAAVTASVMKIGKALEAADKMADDSDPAAGNAIDLPRTQAQENVLRRAAIEALRPYANDTARRLTLALLTGDANSYEGSYAAALDAYAQAAALDPKNEDAIAGVAQSARRLHDYNRVIASDQKLVALDPKSVENLVQLAIDCGTAKHFDQGRGAFDRAVALAGTAANAKGAKPRAVRMLAWVHLYYGRMEVKAKDAVRARRQFALATKAALRLPPSDSRYAIYLEQAQEETVAVDLGFGARAQHGISLAPWTGPELPGSVPGTAKYRLVVTGRGSSRVTLHAVGLPAGWIASFCTDRICAPLRVTTALSPAGVKVIEFQLVPPTAKLPAHLPAVRIDVTDAATAGTGAVSRPG